MPKDRDIADLRAAIAEGAESDVLTQLASETRPEDIGELAVEIALKHNEFPRWFSLSSTWNVWNEKTTELGRTEISYESLKKLQDQTFRAKLADEMNTLIVSLSQCIRRLTLNDETIEDARILICFVRGIYQRSVLQDQASLINPGTYKAAIVNKGLKMLTGQTRTQSYQRVFDAAEELNQQVRRYRETKSEEKKDEVVIHPVLFHVNQERTTKKLNQAELKHLSEQLVLLSKETTEKMKNNELERTKIEAEKKQLTERLSGWRAIISTGKVIRSDNLGAVEEFYSLSEEKRLAWEQQAALDYKNISKATAVNLLRSAASKVGGGYLAPLARKLPLGSQVVGSPVYASTVMAEMLLAGDKKLTELESKLKQLEKDDENCLRVLTDIPQENEDIQAKIKLVSDLKNLMFQLAKIAGEKLGILSQVAVVFFKYAEDTRNIREYFELVIAICLKQSSFTMSNKSKLGVELRKLMNEPQFENLKTQFFAEDPVKYRDLRTLVARSDDKKYFKSFYGEDFSRIESLLSFLQRQEEAASAIPVMFVTSEEKEEVKENELRPAEAESKLSSPKQFQGLFSPKASAQGVPSVPEVALFIGICESYLEERKRQQREGASISLISTLRQSWAEDLIENLRKADKPEKVLDLVNTYLIKNIENTPDNHMGELHQLLVAQVSDLSQQLARSQLLPPAP